MSHPVTFARVLRAEIIRFSTVPSSWIVLVIAALGLIVPGAFIAFNTRTPKSGQSVNLLGPSGTLQGIYAAQLLVGALGVLFVSGEYGTKAIRSTFSTVPTRLPVLAAKAMVITVASVVTATVASLVTFLVGQAVISGSRPGFSITDATAVRVVIGTGLYVTLTALLGSAIAWLVRNTPGALMILFGLILVVPGLLSSILGDSAFGVLNLLPTSAFSVAISPEHPHTFGPWSGLAVLVVWVVVGLAAAAVSVRSRDV